MYSKQINTVFFLLLLGIINLQFLCTKKLDCRGAVYNFELGIRAIPDKDSIQVGDTLWLEVNSPTTLTDVQTGRMIDYSGAENLGSAIAFQAFTASTKQFTVEAVKSFNYVLIQGTEVMNRSPELYKEYLFAESGSKYLFQLGVIPKEKGTFRVIFSNAGSVYRKNDNCTKADFSINFQNTNQHYYLHPSYTGGPTPVGGDYYFKVQ